MNPHKEDKTCPPAGQAEKFTQIDKEARANLIAAIFITVYFWLTIYLFKDSSATLLSLPMWFMLSCIGGYLLSIGVVWFLVRKVMRNFRLDD